MRHILIGTAIALVFAAPAAAEPSIFGEKDAGAYIGIEGGMWFPDKLKVERDISGRAIFDYSVARDVGYDVDLIAGYDFGMIRLEGELAYKRVSHGDADLTTFTEGTFTDSFNDDGHTSAWSAMGNVLLDFGGPDEVNLFVGGGLGYAKVRVDSDLIKSGRLYRDGGFAWQLLAGARYPVNRNFDVGVKYRYADLGNYRESEGTSSLRVNHLRSHSAMFSLIYNFAAAPLPPPPPPPLPPPPPPPPATQTCPDGSVILATDVCPPPPPPPPPPPEPERG